MLGWLVIEWLDEMLGEMLGDMLVGNSEDNLGWTGMKIIHSQLPCLDDVADMCCQLAIRASAIIYLQAKCRISLGQRSLSVNFGSLKL